MGIKWNIPPSEKPIPPNIPLSPTLNIRHLTVTNWMHGHPDDDPFSPMNMPLSHLEIIPPCQETSTAPSQGVVIIAVRSNFSSSISHYEQEPSSVVSRWELYEAEQSLHPAFEKLSSRFNGPGSSPGVRIPTQLRARTNSELQKAFALRKLETLTVPKILLSLHVINVATVLCLAYADGSLDFHNRVSLVEKYAEGSTDKFDHWSQVGLGYVGDDPCQYWR